MPKFHIENNGGTIGAIGDYNEVNMNNVSLPGGQNTRYRHGDTEYHDVHGIKSSIGEKNTTHLNLQPLKLNSDPNHFNSTIQELLRTLSALESMIITTKKNFPNGCPALKIAEVKTSIEQQFVIMKTLAELKFAYGFQLKKKRDLESFSSKLGLNSPWPAFRTMQSFLDEYDLNLLKGQITEVQKVFEFFGDPDISTDLAKTIRNNLLAQKKLCRALADFINVETSLSTINTHLLHLESRHPVQETSSTNTVQTPTPLPQTTTTSEPVPQATSTAEAAPQQPTGDPRFYVKSRGGKIGAIGNNSTAIIGDPNNLPQYVPQSKHQTPTTTSANNFMLDLEDTEVSAIGNNSVGFVDTTTKNLPKGAGNVVASAGSNSVGLVTDSEEKSQKILSYLQIVKQRQASQYRTGAGSNFDFVGTGQDFHFSSMGDGGQGVAIVKQEEQEKETHSPKGSKKKW